METYYRLLEILHLLAPQSKCKLLGLELPGRAYCCSHHTHPVLSICSEGKGAGGQVGGTKGQSNISFYFRDAQRSFPDLWITTVWGNAGKEAITVNTEGARPGIKELPLAVRNLEASVLWFWDLPAAIPSLFRHSPFLCFTFWVPLHLNPCNYLHFAKCFQISGGNTRKWCW